MLHSLHNTTALCYKAVFFLGFSSVILVLEIYIEETVHSLYKNLSSFRPGRQGGRGSDKM